MSGQWWESNLIVGPFSNITEANAWAAANPSSLFLGLLATIGGVPYSWSGTAWDGTRWAAAGNVLPTYETWGEAIAAAGTTKGWVGLVRRLCGNGYFHVMHNGSRLGVQCGESIIRDAGPESAGYSLTAASVAYVPLASYVIPAGLIGDGEEWEGDIHSKITTATATIIPRIRIGGANNIVTAPQSTISNRASRGRGAIVRIGAIVTRMVNNTILDIYENVLQDASTNLSMTQSIDAGFDTGAVGNVMTLRHWAFRRIA